MSENRDVSSGVRELIARLRDDGVKAGREKAENVLKEAREEALMDDAELRPWFYGPSCTLCEDSDWEISQKNMDE